MIKLSSTLTHVTAPGQFVPLRTPKLRVQCPSVFFPRESAEGKYHPHLDSNAQKKLFVFSLSCHGAHEVYQRLLSPA